MKHVKTLTKAQPAKADIGDIFSEIIAWFEGLLEAIKGIFNPA